MPHPVVVLGLSSPARGQRTIESFFKTFHTPKLKDEQNDSGSAKEEDANTRTEESREVMEEVTEVIDIDDNQINDNSAVDITEDREARTNKVTDKEPEVPKPEENHTESNLAIKSRGSKKERKVTLKKKRSIKACKSDSSETDISDTDVMVEREIWTRQSLSNRKANSNMKQNPEENKDENLHKEESSGSSKNLKSRNTSENKCGNNRIVFGDLSSEMSKEITVSSSDDDAKKYPGVGYKGDTCATKASGKLTAGDSIDTVKRDRPNLNCIISEGTVNGVHTENGCSNSDVKREKKNAFAFLMANRHKQNEVIKQAYEADTSKKVECSGKDEDDGENEVESTVGKNILLNSSLEDFQGTGTAALRAFRFSRNSSESEGSHRMSKLSFDSDAENVVCKVQDAVLKHSCEGSDSDRQDKKDANSSLVDFDLTPEKKPKRVTETDSTQRKVSAKKASVTKPVVRKAEKTGILETTKQSDQKPSSVTGQRRRKIQSEPETKVRKQGVKRKICAVDESKDTEKANASVETRKADVTGVAQRSVCESQNQANDHQLPSRKGETSANATLSQNVVTVCSDNTTDPEIKVVNAPVPPRKKPVRKMIVMSDGSGEEDTEGSLETGQVLNAAAKTKVAKLDLMSSKTKNVTRKAQMKAVNKGIEKVQDKDAENIRARKGTRIRIFASSEESENDSEISEARETTCEGSKELLVDDATNTEKKKTKRKSSKTTSSPAKTPDEKLGNKVTNAKCKSLGKKSSKPTKDTQVKRKSAPVSRKLRQDSLSLNGDSDDDVFKSSKASCRKRKVLVDKIKDDTDETNEEEMSEQSLEDSKTKGISSFFKKMSEEEKCEARNRNIIKVKADVHASFDGTCISRKNGKIGKQNYKQDHESAVLASLGTPERRRISQRRKKSKQCHEVEDLNKIELLEQILLPPSPVKMDSTSSNGAKECSKIVVETNESKPLCVNLHNKGKFFSNEDEIISETLEAHPVVNNKKVAEEKSNKQGTEEEEIDMAKVENKENAVDSPVVRRSQRPKKPKFLTVKNKARSSIEDIVAAKHCSSTPIPCKKEGANTSSSDLEENGRTSSSSCSPTSSPKVNDDEKENCGQYTSVLISKPGKLRLKLKRIQLPYQPKEKKRKTLGLKQENSNETLAIKQKARKLVRKAKGNEITKEDKSNTQRRKGKMFLDNSVLPLPAIGATQVNMALVDEELVVIDEIDRKGDAARQTKKKKTKLMSLKPPTPGALKNIKGKKIKKISKVSEKKDNSSVDSEVSSVRKSSRQAARKVKEALIQQIDTIDLKESEKKLSKSSWRDKATQDKELAPIFCKKSKSTSPVELVKVVPLSPSKLKARQEFLHSGVPDDIKKQISVEKSPDELLSWPPFPVVNHVQQKSDDDPLWSLDSPDILKNPESHYIHSRVYLKKPIFKKSIESLIETSPQRCLKSNKMNLLTPTLDLRDMASLLMIIKGRNPQFPVYSIFKRYYDLKKDSVSTYRKELEKDEETVITLEDKDSPKRRKRKRKGNTESDSKHKRSKLSRSNSNPVSDVKVQKNREDNMWHEKTQYTWTQVFAPKSSSLIIGNNGNVKKLKTWLSDWKKKYQVQPTKQKSTKKKKSSKGDFVESSASGSCEDEDDGANTYLLTGPPGTGKTSTVFALAAELGYKVLEVNASSRRPGRQVMNQLAEATQSHSVNNTQSQTMNTFSSFFASKTTAAVAKSVKNAIKNKNEECQQAVKDPDKKKGVSLILFEDIDVIFDEWDEGFMSTVNSLIATAKTPIILTISHPTPGVLARIKGCYEEIKFEPPPVDLIAQHMQLVCLANGYHICQEDVESLVQVNSGDIRQCLLDLQLFALAGSSVISCRCGIQVKSSPNTGNVTEHEDGGTKDMALADIFPDGTSILPKEPVFVKLYKANISTKYLVAEKMSDEETEYSLDLKDRLQSIKGNHWSLYERNLPSLLPFPLTEREKSTKKYPIDSNDPILKTTKLWERHNWLSLDDEDKEDEPEVEPEVEVERESQERQEIPQSVTTVSRQCLESLAHLYDTFTELDILEASHVTTHPNKEIKEQGWWVRQPTAGLSDSHSNPHPYWAPYGIIDDMTHDLSKRALTQCNRDVTSALSSVSAGDWPLLCLTVDSVEKKSNNSAQCIVMKRERTVLSNVWNQLPPVLQLNRSTVLDYLAWVRSLVRQHELLAALNKKRRGRRIICYLTQSGWNIVPNHRLALANALTT